MPAISAEEMRLAWDWEKPSSEIIPPTKKGIPKTMNTPAQPIKIAAITSEFLSVWFTGLLLECTVISYMTFIA